MNIECDDVNVVVAHMTLPFLDYLYKHVPLKKICIVDRPLSDWVNDDIRALKVMRRKNMVIWRKNPLGINYENFHENCMAVNHAIHENKIKSFRKK